MGSLPARRVEGASVRALLRLRGARVKPSPIVPKVMYLFVITGTRLENHPFSPVICL
jgi:hypothetical protein